MVVFRFIKLGWLTNSSKINGCSIVTGFQTPAKVKAPLGTDANGTGDKRHCTR